MSSIQSTFVSIIKTDRGLLCDILKSLDMGNEELYLKLKTSPIPDVPVEFTKKIKVKKEKSDKPRRISGYILFSNDFRAKAKAEGKVVNPKDSIREASEAWKVLDGETKKQWTDLSNKNFEEVVTAYKQIHPDYDPNAKSVKVKINIPRTKSPYIMFISHMSKNEDFKNGKNMMTVAGEKWSGMNDEDKKPFVELSLETKKVANMFQRFINRIKKDLIEEGVEDVKQVIELAAAKKWNILNDEEKAMGDEEPVVEYEKPKKANNTKPKKAIIPTRKSAYNHFVAQFDEEIPEGEKRMVVIAAKWKSMNEQEKEPFVELSDKTKEIVNEFKEFVKENESSIREEIKDKLENETDEKKQNKMITQAAAEKWEEYKNS
tara:strand:- start:1560 stop:2684 length:1125 start_codon:yes stop_codon:yes gene_type:complete